MATKKSKIFTLSDFPKFNTSHCTYVLKANLCFVYDPKNNTHTIYGPTIFKYPLKIVVDKESFNRLLSTNIKSIINVKDAFNKIFPRISLNNNTISDLDYFLLSIPTRKSDHYIHYKDGDYFNLKLDNLAYIKKCNRHSVIVQKVFRKNSQVSKLGKEMHHIHTYVKESVLVYICTIKFDGKRYTRTVSTNNRTDEDAIKLIKQKRDELIKRLESKNQICL